MATYVYTCRNCSKITEFVSSVFDYTSHVGDACGNCSSGELRRLYQGNTAAMFFADGMHVDDTGSL